MTSYRMISTLDLLKTFAVVIMIIDHVGFYFLTPAMGGDAGALELWLRAIGRWGLPIWFFLIGYGKSNSIPPVLMVGAGILVLMNMVTGMFIFPLNALISMILIRLVITPMAQWFFAARETMMAGMMMAFLLYLPTNEICEYGTIGLLMGLMGYAVRAHRDGAPVPVLKDRVTMALFLGLGAAAAIVTQLMSFRFNEPQGIVVGVGMAAVFMALFWVRPTEYPFLNNILPRILKSIIQICGRRTAEIYVIHLTAFKIAALVFGLGYPIYGWFDFDLTIYQAFQHLR